MKMEQFLCMMGYTEVVQLLSNSANDDERVKRMLETADAEGDTLLHHAAKGEHADVIRLLLASRAFPTNANLYGKIPSDLPEARRLLDTASAGMACQ
ncbi:tankyrase-2 [Pyrus ussuriensis x Pyrus communis]|uniref:Tankyrase-2 n=1 Tax=Pyrus ussuriensis x Pyrus communis TaxID=2448454 RepID=A0A5N5H8D7_9ROSA|nr:tankyrase-2 [Pyrus ussuriensis x Pyrus communis]